ncbi:MAG: putative toxin-antitoxin system toxin component, PIN family [Deltaproteobacteria bacterium]|nr:putative toxin-antitoxin system toxin component, PIN family [Deltaproteobacteria bacterium]
MRKVSACIDANVLISAIAFGGKPLEVLERALNREFHVVTGPNILSEVRRNLLGKLALNPRLVDAFLDDFTDVSSVLVPQGNIHSISHPGDNLVLELALIGGCDVIVTGDRKHLLPLSPFKGVIIEPPSKFLVRLRHYESHND